MGPPVSPPVLPGVAVAGGCPAGHRPQDRIAGRCADGRPPQLRWNRAVVQMMTAERLGL